jgi:hypothetical protein
MQLGIDSQIYGFVMLLYSQQLFNQLFNAEENAEWEKIQPIVGEFHKALSEENRWDAYQKCINYNGLDNIVFTGVNDSYYMMYCISNYRVPGIDIDPKVTTFHEKILYYVFVNIVKKSHKYYNKFGSRLI